MKARRIAATPVVVTELGFGAASIGNLHRAMDDDTAASTVAAAVAAGVRYFDTAPHYGLGRSERRLGHALASVDRAGVTVSTKVGRLLEPNPAPTGSDLAANGFDGPDDLRRRFDFSADGVRRSLDASLSRLGLDRVDIVYLHDPDDHLDQAVREAIPALVDWREQGIVGAIGVGMNGWSGPLHFVRQAPVDVVMLAGRWTLLDRTGAPLLDECAERGVSVIAAAPYNSGLLATPRPAPDATFDHGPATVDLVASAHRLADVCSAYGVVLPEAALQFPLRHPAVAAVVTGLGTPRQVDEAVARLSTFVPDALWRDLERPVVE